VWIVGVSTICGVIDLLVPLYGVLICWSAFVWSFVVLDTCWLMVEIHCELSHQPADIQRNKRQENALEQMQPNLEITRDKAHHSWQEHGLYTFS
jgi:hypothetical protein